MSLKGMQAPTPSFSASCLAIHQAGFWSCGGATTGWRSDAQPVRPKPVSNSSWRSRKVVSGRITSAQPAISLGTVSHTTSRSSCWMALMVSCSLGRACIRLVE